MTIEDGGKITLPDDLLPDDLLSRYGLAKRTSVRVIATRAGILLVPLTSEPMSNELFSELEAWQSIGNEGFEIFPYDEKPQR